MSHGISHANHFAARPAASARVYTSTIRAVFQRPCAMLSGILDGDQDPLTRAGRRGSHRSINSVGPCRLTNSLHFQPHALIPLNAADDLEQVARLHAGKGSPHSGRCFGVETVEPTTEWTASPGRLRIL